MPSVRIRHVPRTRERQGKMARFVDAEMLRLCRSQPLMPMSRPFSGQPALPPQYAHRGPSAPRDRTERASSGCGIDKRCMLKKLPCRGA
jgi:hypothetical protein